MPLDVVDAATRSRMMASIKGRDTKPEMIVRCGLHRRGFRFRLHDRKLAGRPDLVLSRYRAAIFVHGCFWHGCPEHYREPDNNSDYWIPKIEKNIKRDQQNSKLIKKMNWKVLRFWEKQITTDLGKCIKKIERALQNGAKSKI